MVNIVVCVKQIPDLEQIKIHPETRKPIIEGVPYEIEELSKKAVETGIRLKELHGGKLTVLSVGLPTLKKTVKEVLAMGADEAILLTDPSYQDYDVQGVACILSHALKKIEYDLIITGEGSSDNYSCQIGPRIAHLQDIPLVTFVREIEFHNHILKATRDLEDCYEIVEVELPAVITVTPESNEPRLPSLSAILQSAKKPIREWTKNDIGLATYTPYVVEISNLAPKMDRKLKIFEGEDYKTIEKLIEELRAQGYFRG